MMYKIPICYCYSNTRGAIVVLKDAALIIIRNAEVTSEVWLSPSLSLNVVQFMINSVLERQVKSSDELIRRLIEERKGKKLADSNDNPSSLSCNVNFTQTNPQISGTSMGGTKMANPSV
jgi:hypothetical protein